MRLVISALMIVLSGGVADARCFPESDKEEMRGRFTVVESRKPTVRCGSVFDDNRTNESMVAKRCLITLRSIKSGLPVTVLADENACALQRGAQVEAELIDACCGSGMAFDCKKSFEESVGKLKNSDLACVLGGRFGVKKLDVVSKQGKK